MAIHFQGIDREQVVEFPTPAVPDYPVSRVIVDCGTALFNFDGTNFDDWDRLVTDFYPQKIRTIPVGYFISSAATASLATIFFNTTPLETPGYGFAVDWAEAAYDDVQRKVKVTVQLAVWSPLASLIRVAYQVTVVSAYLPPLPPIIEGPGS